MIRLRLASAAAALALVAGLAGCSASTLDAATSDRLQESVVAIAESAAAGDPAGAVAQLDALQEQLDEAMAADLVSAARAARVQRAIDVVRTDLQGLVDAEPEPSPSPSQAGETDDEGSDDGDTGGGNENSGPGNNNGNDDDKDNGKGNSGKGKG